MNEDPCKRNVTDPGFFDNRSREEIEQVARDYGGIQQGIDASTTEELILFIKRRINQAIGNPTFTPTVDHIDIKLGGGGPRQIECSSVPADFIHIDSFKEGYIQHSDRLGDQELGWYYYCGSLEKWIGPYVTVMLVEEAFSGSTSSLARRDQTHSLGPSPAGFKRVEHERPDESLDSFRKSFDEAVEARAQEKLEEYIKGFLDTEVGKIGKDEVVLLRIPGTAHQLELVRNHWSAAIRGLKVSALCIPQSFDIETLPKKDVIKFLEQLRDK